MHLLRSKSEMKILFTTQGAPCVVNKIFIAIFVACHAILRRIRCLSVLCHIRHPSYYFAAYLSSFTLLHTQSIWQRHEIFDPLFFFIRSIYLRALIHRLKPFRIGPRICREIWDTVFVWNGRLLWFQWDCWSGFGGFYEIAEADSAVSLRPQFKFYHRIGFRSCNKTAKVASTVAISGF
jgi:hypothetical protein